MNVKTHVKAGGISRGEESQPGRWWAKRPTGRAAYLQPIGPSV